MSNMANAITSTLNVQPSNYNGLEVSWTLPSGNWTQLYLLRSSFGTPLSIFSNDGVVLLEQTSNFSTSFVNEPLESGFFYYYSIIVYSPTLGEYVLAGAAQGLVLTEFDLGSTFQAWMPDWYNEQDQAFITTQQPEGPLERFLNLLGYEEDWIKSEIQSFFTATNIDLASGYLIPFIGGNFDIDYEPELGMTRSRALVKNAVFLYKFKGTTGGIAAAASSFSGFGCEVTAGKNLEIQLDDYAFDRSTGHWVPGNSSTTISREGAATAGVSPAYTSYDPATTNAGSPWVSGQLYLAGTYVTAVVGGVTCVYFSIHTVQSTTSPPNDRTNWIPVNYLPVNNFNVGVMSGNAATPQPIWLTTCTEATATTLGIPVAQTATPPMYVFSYYVQPQQQTTPTLRSFLAQIDWYNIFGAFISSTVGSAVAEVADTWVRPYVVGTPPAGAYYFGRTVKSVQSITGDNHLFCGAQSEINTQATPGPSSLEPPRAIKLNLFPSRQNLIPNPVGRAAANSGVFGWSTSNGAFAASAFMATPPAITWPANTSSGFVITTFIGGTQVPGPAMFGAIIPGISGLGFSMLGGNLSTGPGNVISSLLISVNAGDPYSLSVYFMAATVSREIQLSITYYNAAGQLLALPAFAASLSSELLSGQTYNALPLNSLPFAVSAGEPIIINFGTSSQQLVHASAALPATGSPVALPVFPFVAAGTYPASTPVSFSYITFTDAVGVWTRGDLINALIPIGATQAFLQFTIVNPATDEVHYLGAPLFEPVAYLGTYFDANFLPSTDFFWEGIANESISDYYPSLQSKLSRLISVMPEFTPIGSTFSLVTMQRAFTNVNEIG